MKTVRQILDGKGRQVWSIGPDATVYQALELMAERKIGAVVVTEEEGLIGILSERDYARKVVLLGRDSRQTPVRDIMTANPVCVRPDQDAQQCMALMTEKRVRHLPVLQDDRLVGMISIGDVVKSIISEHEFVIQQLENYISGR